MINERIEKLIQQTELAELQNRSENKWPYTIIAHIHRRMPPKSDVIRYFECMHRGPSGLVLKVEDNGDEYIVRARFDSRRLLPFLRGLLR